MISATILKVINFVPKAVYFGILVVVILALVFQSCTVKRQVAEVAKARVAVDQAKVTNVHNVGVIDDLIAKLRATVAGRQADEQAHKTAVDKWEVERDLLEVKANERETEAVEVYRDPECADLAKLNITYICPGFVDGMRERADSLNRNRNTGNTDPG